MERLYEGTLKKEEETQYFHVQILTSEHLQEILQVQAEVVSKLNNQSTLQPLTEEEFQYILDGHGLMLGAFVGNELIAFRALLAPIIDDEHLGRDIGLKDDELPSVIYQEISNVLPAYRGNQLQKTLAILIMEELAKQEHSFRYVCCTVAPFNIPSLKDKFSQGMQIAALKVKYGGSLRYIFVQDLQHTNHLDWTETVYISMDDTSAQQLKLAEGFRGIGMEERDGKLIVKYGKE
ncbi:GNAT family N-acetyltransferase [Bacillus sp. Bva_UNVM-123]|uniref:GNAT family N-acetyltransferase n=1 Tax=Bacillus sp. Bva_UNVM-123 TaxID=2829798 RepID=UPI00391EFD28